VKAVIIVLLAVIAVGVGYLAYSKYREKQDMTDAIEALANPDAYAARRFSDMAKLKCQYGFGDVSTRTAPAGLVPVRFLCRADTGAWSIAERECTEAERELPPGGSGLGKGSPRRIGEVYKPAYVLCWEVLAKE